MARTKAMAVVGLLAALGCGSEGGGTSLEDLADGEWSCIVEGERTEFFESPEEALEAGYFTEFSLEIEPDSATEGSFLMTIPHGASKGAHEGTWELDGSDLAVRFDAPPSDGTDGVLAQDEYAFEGVEDEAQEITYLPAFDEESGEVAVDLVGDEVTLSWDGYDGGTSTGVWTATCSRP